MLYMSRTVRRMNSGTGLWWTPFVSKTSTRSTVSSTYNTPTIGTAQEMAKKGQAGTPNAIIGYRNVLRKMLTSVEMRLVCTEMAGARAGGPALSANMLGEAASLDALFLLLLLNTPIL